MSPTSRTTFTKRQKERARLEKQRDKAERRSQKKLEQGNTPADSLIDEEAAANQMLTPEELLQNRKGE